MKKNSFRRGSALLIVLGMMAFIVVSAVAFSAYMRYSRLPSSYLRRTSSSRLLVKAALAEAIDAIDRSIGNNPYPGVGGTYHQENGSLSQKNRNNYLMNHWKDRVFIGAQNTVNPEDTVSTLTVEGLAYIPAPFINEMRYWSRRSPAAEWHTMGFDAGRYAFSALDVSDCFDVNRLLADVPRDSSDENRITLSHCFEKHVNDSDSGDTYFFEPENWGGFIENYVDEDGSKVPLVSVADLNLAIANRLGGEIAKKLSPFYRFITQNSDAYFVESEDNADAALMRNLAFVTDSYFPVTNRVANAIDLSRERDQPFYNFRRDTKDQNETIFEDIYERDNRFGNLYKDREILYPEYACLSDYLDLDSIPMSLCLPTWERAPMITGVGLGADLSLQLSKREEILNQTDNSNPNRPIQRHYRKTLWDLKLIGDLRASVGVVFPFKYTRGNTSNYKVQLAATITLMKKGLSKDDALRRRRAVFPAAITKDKWASGAQSAQLQSYTTGNVQTPAVITLFSAPQAVSIKSKIEQEEDAVCSDVKIDFNTINLSLATEMPDSAPITPSIKDTAVLRTVDELEDDGVTVKTKNVNPEKFNIGVSGADLDQALEIIGSEEYAPYIQVWARILNGNHVVDLVPAYWRDDEQISEHLEIGASQYLPLVRFMPADGSAGLAFTRDAFENYQDPIKPGFYPNVYFANDPRFNYAPECLVANSTCTFDEEIGKYWFEHIQNASSRDGDIFMTTSDAGYMQSAYELAHILDLSAGGQYVMGVLDDGQGFNGAVRSDISRLAAKDSMWRSYTQYRLNGREKMISPLDIINGSRGFRINPYTSDVNIMLAALANTPMDWWAASTNDVDTVKNKMLSSLKEGNKYTFSSHSGAAIKIEHGAVRNEKEGTLVQLAKKMMGHFRTNYDNVNWQDAFDNDINWNEEDKIDGVDLGVTLHSIDKKFLHGYWRECFANRQQLFLVFVRAEPMMLGGGGLGQTPPQLGARAVALVWRSPQGTGNDDDGLPKPHRTRILFYRQFD